jgi:hypothetical protein
MVAAALELKPRLFLMENVPGMPHLRPPANTQGRGTGHVQFFPRRGSYKSYHERTQMVETQSPFAMITCKREVTVRQVRNLLSVAFEGGSNYWLVIKRRYFAPGITYEDFREGGKFQPPGDYFHPDELIPTVDYCGLIVTTNDDEEEKLYDLNGSTLRDGLQRMADKQPRHWQDFLEENEDAGTGDVFLQLCLFNEVVYG